jgi:hypothetical protein
MATAKAMNKKAIKRVEDNRDSIFFSMSWEYVFYKLAQMYSKTKTFPRSLTKV